MEQRNRYRTPWGRVVARILDQVRFSGVHGPANIHNSLAPEMINQILGYVGEVSFGTRSPATTAAAALPSVHPASIPPSDLNVSPLGVLATELLRKIFAHSLPSKDRFIEPRCAHDEGSPAPAVAASSWDIPASAATQVPKKERPRPNPTSDLMLVNKRMCDIVREVVYEEREFVIHVHEGFKNGGIEFVNAGRQPLQFQASPEDGRFYRFAIDDKFGFHQLKKIKIVIFPGEGDIELNRRHTTLNTFYMIEALCRLLDHGRTGKEITKLRVAFAKTRSAPDAFGRRQIMRLDNRWWDSDKKEPREQSLKNISDIEIVLRSLIMLEAHNVQINLPFQLEWHPDTKVFKRKLIASMHRGVAKLFSDDFDREMSGSRDAFNEYLVRMLHNGTGFEVPGVTEEEFQEDKIARDTMRLKRTSPQSAKGGKRVKLDEDLIRADEEVAAALQLSMNVEDLCERLPKLSKSQAQKYLEDTGSIEAAIDLYYANAAEFPELHESQPDFGGYGSMGMPEIPPVPTDDSIGNALVSRRQVTFYNDGTQQIIETFVPTGSKKETRASSPVPMLASSPSDMGVPAPRREGLRPRTAAVQTAPAPSSSRRNAAKLAMVAQIDRVRDSANDTHAQATDQNGAQAQTGDANIDIGVGELHIDGQEKAVAGEAREAGQIDDDGMDSFMFDDSDGEEIDFGADSEGDDEESNGMEVE